MVFLSLLPPTHYGRVVSEGAWDLKVLLGGEALQRPVKGVGPGDLQADVQERVRGVALVLAAHATHLQGVIERFSVSTELFFKVL